MGSCVVLTGCNGIGCVEGFVLQCSHILDGYESDVEPPPDPAPLGSPPSVQGLCGVRPRVRTA